MFTNIYTLSDSYTHIFYLNSFIFYYTIDIGRSALFKHKDINEYLKEKEDSTILLDVRTKEEYEEGHIPGSINVELDYINTVKDVIKDKESKIYLYCRSGHRSGIALNAMKELGYTDLTNIGGIIHYKGELE